jgi:hypothetical protein
MPVTSFPKSRPRTATQRSASRTNARKSIGPKTVGRKRVPSLNGVKAGGEDSEASNVKQEYGFNGLFILTEEPSKYVKTRHIKSC